MKPLSHTASSKKHRILILYALLLILLPANHATALAFNNTSTTTTVPQQLTINPQKLAMEAYAGDSVEYPLKVKNNINRSLVIAAASAVGELKGIITLENAPVVIESYEERTVGLKYYVNHKTQPKTYSGEILLTTGDVEYRIPTILNVSEPGKRVRLELEVYPFTPTIESGIPLKIQYDVKNLGDGKVNVQLDLFLIDPDSNETLSNESDGFTVSTKTSRTIVLDIPKDIKQKKYLIKGLLYYVSTEYGKTLKASSSAYVEVKHSTIRSLTAMVEGLFTRSNLELLLASIPVIIIFVLYYRHYKDEQLKQRRYIEAIDFDALPKPSLRSTYIGRIAETSLRAFGDLDVLQMHSLVAGATGSGKTVAAQVLVEEALLKGVSVMVFDPTAQWTGFLRKCDAGNMLRLYPNFNMKTDDARAFNGNIRIIKSVDQKFDVRNFMNPGEINVFCMHKLNPSDIDVVVESTVKDVFSAHLQDNPELRLLIVYDEVHRLLPKFGGSGRGFIQVERAAREFRKWGVGLVLVSQVLSDFVGEIKANIGTEIQMRTRYEQDMDRIRMKYGEETMLSIVKASVGTGMIQNAEYNRGRPYFVSFRPLLHTPFRLSDSEIESYEKSNVRIDILKAALDKLEAAEVDVFDLRLELNLALENVKKGAFDVVELYLESIEPRIKEYWNKLKEGKIGREDLALSSEWDAKKDVEFTAYERDLEGGVFDDKDRLLQESEELFQKLEEGRRKLEEEKKKILEEEQRKANELDEKKLKLVEDAPSLSEKEVLEKESELMKIGDELKALADEKTTAIELKEELEKKLGKSRLELEKDLLKIEGRLLWMTDDKEVLRDRGEMLDTDEQHLKEFLEKEVQLATEDIIEKMRGLRKTVVEEDSGVKAQIFNMLFSRAMARRREKRGLELKATEERLKHSLEKSKKEKYTETKSKRAEIVQRKDVLLEELRKIREIWLKIIENERRVRLREKETMEQMREWRAKIAGERERIKEEEDRIRREFAAEKERVARGDAALKEPVVIKTAEELARKREEKYRRIDAEFKQLNDDWSRIDEWMSEVRKLESELDSVRDEWGKQESLRLGEEEKIKVKEDEIKKLDEEEKTEDKDDNKIEEDGK